MVQIFGGSVQCSSAIFSVIEFYDAGVRSYKSLSYFFHIHLGPGWFVTAFHNQNCNRTPLSGSCAIVPPEGFIKTAPSATKTGLRKIRPVKTRFIRDSGGLSEKIFSEGVNFIKNLKTSLRISAIFQNSRKLLKRRLWRQNHLKTYSFSKKFHSYPLPWTDLVQS